MDLTYSGVKAGKLDFDTSGFEKPSASFFDKGAQTLILGCTELPRRLKCTALTTSTSTPPLCLRARGSPAAGGKLREA